MGAEEKKGECRGSELFSLKRSALHSRPSEADAENWISDLLVGRSQDPEVVSAKFAGAADEGDGQGEPMDDLIGVTRTLTPEAVEAAYREGVFPMGEPRLGIITWHCPDPRAVIPLDGFHKSRSLRKTLRKGLFEVTYDRDFPAVMDGCAEGRPVWITAKVRKVYTELHRQGKAHSVEVWKEGRLVGGVYGVHLGGAFMAESKFHRETDASKVALASLVNRLKERGFDILEVQYLTEHLRQFGTQEISLEDYLKRLKVALKKACTFT